MSTTINVKDLGAVGDGTTDDGPVLQKAFAKGAGGVVYIPWGRYRFERTLRLPSATTIYGDGRHSTVLIYDPAQAGWPGLCATQAQTAIHIRDLQVENKGSDSLRGSVKANTASISLLDCTECIIERVTFLGGHRGVEIAKAGDSWWTWNPDAVAGNDDLNAGHVVRDCRAQHQAGSSYFVHAASGILLEGNAAQGAPHTFPLRNDDGFKIGGRSQGIRVLGNHAEHMGRDGFDFYDGITASVVSNNIARQNFLQGFEIKGKALPDGNRSLSETIFSGNLAVGNGFDPLNRLNPGDSEGQGRFPGFSVGNVRNLTFNGNLATGNAGPGFQYVEVQNGTFTGDQATRNGGDGFSILETVSRCSWTGCTAAANGVDGRGMYAGFHLHEAARAASISLLGCHARNATAPPTGGQQYGLWLEGAQNEVVIVGCVLTPGNLIAGITTTGGHYHQIHNLVEPGLFT